MVKVEESDDKGSDRGTIIRRGGEMTLSSKVLRQWIIYVLQKVLQ